MSAGITLWLRQGEADSADAQAFLRQNRYGADAVRDILADPPRGAEIDRLRKGLGGSLRPAADTRKAPELAHHAEEALENALKADSDLWRTPILLTPKGAVAGFRERRWREFLDIGKGR
ncbi:MAG TPA: hypothetical protein VFH47_06765 [Candidatus Thermoplasmatota archaeon]|nr:hypothetical protein [Candidatus Thermoplasmatota archaeon]